MVGRKSVTVGKGVQNDAPRGKREVWDTVGDLARASLPLVVGVTQEAGQHSSAGVLDEHERVLHQMELNTRQLSPRYEKKRKHEREREMMAKGRRVRRREGNAVEKIYTPRPLPSP